MAIWNLGSINVDYVYTVPHIPAPGETLASTARDVFMGGKGVNMSVAAARAASQVKHIGAVGKDGAWTVQTLTEYGVDTRFITTLDADTGHAVIAVAGSGENAILLLPGANNQVPHALLQTALAEAQTRDWFVTQNETNLQRTGAQLARKMGLKVAYAAAPFNVERVMAVRDHLDLLILNDVEAQQLEQATGGTVTDMGVPDVIITRGGDGADWFAQGQKTHFDAEKVDPVDTTGAGDTFTGYLLAGLDRGMPMVQAIGLASKAAALMVTRLGTADVIPDLQEVQAFQQSKNRP